MQFLLILIISLGLSHSVAARGAHALQPVRFATSSVTPWGIAEVGRQPSGLLVSVLESLQEVTDIPVNNQMMPYPRVIHSVFTGAVDFAVLFDSPMAQKNALRVGHLVDTRILIIALAGNQPVSSVAELQGKTVGHINGSKYGPEFDNSTDIKRLPVNTMFQGVAMLLRNRLDAMAGTDQAVYWVLEKMHVDPSALTVVMDFAGSSGSLYMSRHSSRKELLPVYREALDSLKDNGTLSEIFNRHYQWSDQKDRILSNPSVAR